MFWSACSANATRRAGCRDPRPARVIAIGADTSQVDGSAEFSAAREDDVHLIRLGDERYEIFDAVTLGG